MGRRTDRRDGGICDRLSLTSTLQTSVEFVGTRKISIEDQVDGMNDGQWDLLVISFVD